MAHCFQTEFEQRADKRIHITCDLWGVLGKGPVAFGPVVSYLSWSHRACVNEKLNLYTWK